VAPFAWFISHIASRTGHEVWLWTCHVANWLARWKGDALSKRDSWHF